MSEKIKKKIVIIGCGAVAWHLAEKFRRDELFIYNHKANPALASFKTEFKANTFQSLKNIIPNGDVYLISIKDSFITPVLETLSYLPTTSVICVTSGNYNLKDYKGTLKLTGIVYPLQSFSKDDELKWKDIPIITDALTKTSLSKITEVARMLSDEIIHLNYEQRLKLHLAAVLANNFTNSLYAEADKVLKSIGSAYSVKLLYPLIKQSVKKIKYISPLEAQTGPAKRNDKEVMAKHMTLLKDNPQLAEIYKLMSNLIQSQQKRKT